MRILFLSSFLGLIWGLPRLKGHVTVPHIVRLWEPLLCPLPPSPFSLFTLGSPPPPCIFRTRKRAKIRSFRRMGAGSSDGKRGNFPPFDPLFCYKADYCVFNPWKNAKILKITRPYALENRLNVSFLSWLKKGSEHPSRGLEGCPCVNIFCRCRHSCSSNEGSILCGRARGWRVICRLLLYRV